MNRYLSTAIPMLLNKPVRERREHLPLDVKTHKYRVNNEVSIESDIELPELEFFKTSRISDVDLLIHNSGVGLSQHNGNVISNPLFKIVIGEPLEVFASPLLASSPHVLYTNIVEPLLRFLFASNGRVLLHSACFSLNDKGVLISAPTDTGKTSTVTRLISKTSCGFLSDDMTIIDRRGVAYGFPKQLTVSLRLLESLRVELDARRRLIMLIKSKVHSRMGRKILRFIGKIGSSTLAINAVGQIIVPPPKIGIWRILPGVKLLRETPIDYIFLMKRGEPLIKEISTGLLLTQVLENQEDAYNVPPYNYVTTRLKMNGYSYNELRLMEKRVLMEAFSGSRAILISTPDYSWGEEIERIVSSDEINVDEC